MVKCTKCQTENDDLNKFCRKCGNDLLVNKEAPTQTELKVLAEELNKKSSENNKKSLNTVLTEIPMKIFSAIKNSIFFRKKKNTIITSISVVLLIALIITLITFIIPLYYYNQGNQEFKSGNYQNAIEYYEKANNYSDSSDKIVLAKRAFYYSEGVLDLNNKDYDAAIDNFKKANNYKDSDNMIKECYYNKGVLDLNNKDYNSAIDNFKKSNNYKDSDYMINVCNFLIAESDFASGIYDKAGSIYTALPTDFKYNGISVQQRLQGLKTYDSFKNMEGTYSVLKGNYSVRQIGDYGYWYGWDAVQGYGDLKVNIKINDDATVTISGTATGTRYTKYSSIAAGLKEGTYSASFSKKLSGGSFPISTLYSDGKVVLKYIGGNKFTLDYSDTNRSEDVYFTYKYTSNYTFGK